MNANICLRNVVCHWNRIPPPEINHPQTPAYNLAEHHSLVATPPDHHLQYLQLIFNKLTKPYDLTSSPILPKKKPRHDTSRWACCQQYQRLLRGYPGQPIPTMELIPVMDPTRIYRLPIPTRNWYHLKSTRFEYTFCFFSLSAFLSLIPSNNPRRHHQHADPKTNETETKRTHAHTTTPREPFFSRGGEGVVFLYNTITHTIILIIIINMYNK